MVPAILAFVVYKVSSKLLDWILLKAFKYEKPTFMDHMFMYDRQEAPSNVFGVLEFEKFKYEEMRDYIIQKIKKINLSRWRSKLVDFFGKTYYVPMTDEEWKTKEKEVHIKVDGVHNKKQLNEFVSKLMAVRFDFYDNVLYRWYYIPDYTDEVSLVIIYDHHSFSDGSSSFPFFIAISEDKNFKALGVINPPDFTQRLKGILLLPIMMPIEAFKLFTKPSEHNAIQNIEGASAVRSVRYSDSYDHKKLKEAFKKNKCTLNQGMLLIFGMTIKEYAKIKKQIDVDYITVN
jgi:hypothetical protein